MSSLNILGIPVYIMGPYGWSLFVVPRGTVFTPVVTIDDALQPAVVVEPSAPEGDMTDEEEAAFDKFVEETKEKEKAEKEAEEWWHSEIKKEEEQMAHVARLLQEEDKKKEKAKELFVEANKWFQIQKALFQKNGPRAELHAAQEAYIRIIEELRALMVEIDEPTFTLRAMADERWPEENHDDFEQKLKVIYESIKSKVAHYNRKPGVVRKPVAGKPAPAAATLADILSAQLAKEAAGGGNA